MQATLTDTDEESMTPHDSIPELY